MAPFEALHERSCQSPAYWMEIGDALLLGLKLVRETIEKVNIIQECIKTAQSRQKSYADRKRKGVELNVRDFMFLKVSLMKGIMRFGKKGKLALRFVGPYKITKKIHPSQVVSPEVLEISDDLTFESTPRVSIEFKVALDGGLDIPHSDKRFSGFLNESKHLDAEVHRKYIYGGHVAAYMKILMEDEPDKYQSHFVEYIKRGIEPDGIEELYKKVHAAIHADSIQKKSEKEPPKQHKREQETYYCFSQENLKW
ncbi:60S ribosomal protein L5-B-like [Camellia sinensis]|uniref:60S ribosomal protein L5-B-like n=1 Tax=Camellia sinensis TaxID=4442 RepID=UPI00103652EA|nr:60S ribosomal protein L5-B-like [Camellia sinensis]